MKSVASAIVASSLLLSSLYVVATPDGPFSVPTFSFDAVPSSYPTFDEYVNEYAKGYECAHKRAEAEEAYDANLALIKAHNELYEQGKVSYLMAVNKFTDGSEVHRGYRAANEDASSSESAQQRRLNTIVTLSIEESLDVDPSTLPSEVDWTDYLTGVKEQGMCGSCFAVASVETLEAHASIYTGKKGDLSIQQVLDCLTYDEGSKFRGCSGGFPEQVYNLVADMGGLATEWTYPYESGHGDDHHKCRFNASKATKPGMPRFRNSSIRAGTPPAIRIDGFASVEQNNMYATMHALATKGPLTVVVAADDNWSKYGGGVLDSDYDPTKTDNNTLALDHAVQLVGYGTDEVHGAYWKVRNSWGLDFGENGFIRLRRMTDPKDMICKHDGGTNTTACGPSGVLQSPTYPVNVRHATTRVTPH